MSNLKKIKKKLIKNKKWKEYKDIFRHKQMRFIYSDIMLYFNDETDLDFLVKSEISLMKTKKGPEMFVETFSSIPIFLSKEIDWVSFAKFLWFQYQTSTYWKDVKKKKDNIFNKKNYIENNAKKRALWQGWITSIGKNNKDFNDIITFVLRKVS